MNWRSLLLYVFKMAWGTILVTWIVAIVSVLLSLVLPAQVGALTNLFEANATRAVTWDMVNRALAIAVLAQLGVAVLVFIKARNLVLIEEDLVRRMAIDLLARVLRFGDAFFQGRNVESITVRILEDAKTMVSVFSFGISTVPPNLFCLVFLAVYMIRMNWLLGSVMVVLGALSCYFLVIDDKIQRINKMQRQAWDQVRSRSLEVISGAAELRGHHAFGYGVNRVSESFDQNWKAMVQVGQWNAFFQAASPLVSTIQKSALYWLGAGLCISGSWVAEIGGAITWGRVIELMLVVHIYSSVVYDLAIALLTYRMGRQQIRRVGELLEHPLDTPESPEECMPHQAPESEPLDITLENLSCDFESGAHVLASVNVEISPGEHVAIVGPAGCGKSTLLRTLNRGIRPSEGHVRLSGRELSEMDPLALARSVGLVPQNPVLFNTSIRNNILLSLRRPSSKSLRDDEGTIDAAGLHDVQSDEDLDRELIGLARSVALEDDLVTKALDSRPWEWSRFPAVGSLIPQLRENIRRELSVCEKEILVHFHKDGYLTEGTLRREPLRVRTSHSRPEEA